MGSPQSEAVEVIVRYLAGQLTPAEQDAFERALTERPELREQTEEVLKLREGLARLRERGELDALLRATARPWVAYAAAAAVAIISLVGLAWFYTSATPPKLLALSPAQFVSGGHAPAPVVGSYVLARTRGSLPVTELRRSGLIEIRVLPSVLSSSVSYRARLTTSDGTAGGRLLSQVDTGRAAGDGYITFYLDSAQLAPGDYELLLTPTVAAGPDSNADRFPIRVR